MFIARSWLSLSVLVGLSLLLAACGAPPETKPAAAESVAGTTAGPAAEAAVAASSAELDAIVDTYRRILVLMSDEGTLAAPDRPRAFLAGKLLFERNRHALAELETAGETALEASRENRFGADPRPVLALLDRLEQDPLWRDADKLVFRDVLSAWTLTLREPAPGSPKGKALLLRLTEDLQALDQIQQLYEKEIEKVFAQFGTRGIPIRREAWESYLAFLRQNLAAQSIFDLLRPELPPPPPVALPAAKAFDGAKLPEKTLVLTFDDGPHGSNTPKILEILKRYNAPAIFFAVGENLGRYDEKGVFKPSRAAAATRAALGAGHLLANHTQSHAQLPRLAADGVEEQIDEMSRRARELDPAGIKLFRPPYGAWSDEVARQAGDRQMKLMLWNIDSQDWADPVAASIANRVVAEARSAGRGIVLFHDIHARTVEALPLVIETLQAEGYRFVLYDGETLTEPRGLPAPLEKPAAPAPQLYAESHAVVIGIDDYEHWPKLTYAVADALALRELLVRRLGFSPANVHMLLDREATREKILELLGERMADPARVGKEDRLLVFYAGHGATRQLGSGRSLGYVVPADAALDRLHSQAISMTQFGDIDEALPAKHVLYLMDACYGGLALLRGGAGSRNFLRETTQRRARQMITAGGADELVADGGPGGHSIFTWTLLQGLGGEADLNRDGYVTATELFAYTGPLVAQLSRQTPAFGSLPGSEGGEMVFALEPDEEFLSAESTQLDEEAIALNQQLVEVRSEIAARKDRNSKLKRELDQARDELARLSAEPAASATADLPVKRRARERHEQGLELFRQKRYDDALAALREAAELVPDSALYTNNLGFVHYRRGELDLALDFYEKTKKLDPARIQVYMNEGSALEALGRNEEAAAAYRKFLELAPDHRDAGYARRRLESLESGRGPAASAGS